MVAASHSRSARQEAAALPGHKAARLRSEHCVCRDSLNTAKRGMPRLPPAVAAAAPEASFDCTPRPKKSRSLSDHHRLAQQHHCRRSASRGCGVYRRPHGSVIASSALRIGSATARLGVPRSGRRRGREPHRAPPPPRRRCAPPPRRRCRCRRRPTRRARARRTCGPRAGRATAPGPTAGPATASAAPPPSAAAPPPRWRSRAVRSASPERGFRRRGRRCAAARRLPRARRRGAAARSPSS